jgi:hypothetical protein
MNVKALAVTAVVALVAVAIASRIPAVSKAVFGS